MGFYRFKTGLRIFGIYVPNGAKISKKGDEIKIVKTYAGRKELFMKEGADTFFEEMEKYPDIKKKMKDNLKRRIKV